ncbi:VOC family protein [Mucilaginibacter gynuensis]|uniref:VOC family protein n=1 Tax=Mucilaginibacter gynuensis TaxID=1302236 RepID=A0ABP8GHJ5_9SPHI
MATINPYLNFNGNTEEVFNFYKSVFGGEFAMLMRFKDTQDCSGMAEAEQNLIMHVALPIGPTTILMASDVPPSMPASTTGTNFSISISVDSKEEGDRIFTGLSEGGQVTLPMQTMFWGAYFGMLIDKFGINWMVNYDEKYTQ